MVLPGHIAGGYMATKALLFLTHASFAPAQITAIYVAGILASEGPDIDLFWFYIVHKFKLGNDQSHRDYLTHAPVVWLALSLSIVLIGALIGSLFTEFIGWAILCGSWSHFIFDSIEYGIAWLWPLNKKRFALIQVTDEVVTNEIAGTLPAYWRFLTKVYIKRVTMYAEIAVVLIALYMALS